ncbi:hypothetical protein AK812_SmicGene4645 [Symbiodinium microadriaticum]|uniref:Uncharacterized protein n=1 Tax=Symbiodinium microadriaticum TaxID=2951 RepID=A0A1Q9EVS9_SYMMI|nr:hypothetical protein AK812_SmicGene4645 [Symbiodinium microadriaticum]
MSPSAHAYGHANGHSGTSRGMDPSAHAYGWLRPRTGTARPRRPEILFIKKAKIRPSLPGGPRCRETLVAGRQEASVPETDAGAKRTVRW